MIYRRLYGIPSFDYRDTYGELEKMRRQMDRLFTDFSTAGTLGSGAGVFPLVNITEDKDAFYICAELPGVKSDELDIQATENNISISGKRRIESEGENVKYHRREREAGTFSRVIGMPSNVESDRVAAKLVNGVLTLTVPKADAAKPRQITVG
jgi:HSP20 family protein